MKRLFTLAILIVSLQVCAQDSTMNSLMKEMDKSGTHEKKVVKVFESDRLINANSPEVIKKGKMDFKVTHNFGDAAGKTGGIKNFFGLDASTDVRIGFHIGLTDRLNINIAHAKGDEQIFRGDSAVNKLDYNLRKLYELALKYQLLRQYENDPSHPVAVTLFVNTVVSTMAIVKTGNPPVPALNKPNSFADFGDRLSQVFQVIIAKKMGKISLELTPTLVHYNYVPSYSDKSTFALGGAARIPVTNSFAILVDYFHCFISDSKKTNYKTLQGVKFYDPLSIGFEFLTSGHVFHLNFTNTTAILENQFIPFNTNTWGKGQFRWGFDLSRTFVLWRDKK